MASNIQEQEIKREKPSSSTSDTTQEQEKFERRIFDCIAEQIAVNQWKFLGLNLELTCNHLSEVEKSSLGQPTSYTTHLMLEKWKHLKNPRAYQLNPLLSSALEAIGRNDIVHMIQQIKLEKKPEERKVKTGTIKEPEKFKRRIFDCIAKDLHVDQWKCLGLKLDISLNDLKDLENKSDGERQFTIIQMLNKWKQLKNPTLDEFIPLLSSALAAIDRNDIVHKIQLIEKEESMK